ncbi:hypothetical protein HYU40_02700 [Candidatus Woesearchaeota archaeon]|nr:hypothetical protein [Candidatus Woesearchaeota archaeon]
MAFEIRWYLMFAAILLAFVGILAYTKDRRYLFYFVTGGIVGFYLDVVSVSQGYYSYDYAFYQYFPMLFGVPLTFPMVEGASIAIVIFVYREVVAKVVTKIAGKLAIK